MSSGTRILVERITGSIGAIIGGLDLRRPLSDSAAQLVRKALLDNGVIFLRGQHIDMEQYWVRAEI